MNRERLIELAKRAHIEWDELEGCSDYRVSLEELDRFSELVRAEALEEAKEVCRQVVRETNTTLTWEGCNEIQEALEREKS